MTTTLTVNSVSYQQADDSQSDHASHISAPSSATSQHGESYPATSSIPDHQEDCPTNHGSSSQSQTSSRVSDAATQGSSAIPKPDNSDTVKGVILEELRDDPEVAELAFQKLKGVLEYAPRAPRKEILEPSDLLTMFNVHTIEEEPIYHHGVFTCAPTSNSGTSSSKSNPERDKGSSKSSASSSGSSFGISSASLSRDTTEDGSSGPSTKQDKGKSILGAPTEDGAHGLRCFHNAVLPETFCPNHHTGSRFRSCAGSGWHTFQHVK